jgi:hypothetical protein
MDIRQEAQAALHEFLKNRTTIQVVVAKVLNVDMQDETCDVQDLQGHEYYNVRLRAQKTSGGMLVVPKIESNVLIGSIGNSDIDYFIVSHSEVSSVKIKIDNTLYEVDNQGFVIKKGGEDLKKIMSDLITAITTLTVTCAAPATPSTVPLNAAVFTQIKTRLNLLFK